MTKKLKDVLDPKGYTPKAGEEKAFEKVHTVQDHDYRADIVGKRKGSGNEVFNASNVKVSPRPGKSSVPGQVTVSESDYPGVGESSAPLNTMSHKESQWHHREQFMHHSQAAIDAKLKSNGTRARANVESDRVMKDHFLGLADHYHGATKHHLKMAALHAKKFQMSEDTDAKEMLQAVNESVEDLEDLIDLDELTAPITQASAIEKKKTPKSGRSWHLTKTIKKAVRKS
jgi:hypothetical protein